MAVLLTTKSMQKYYESRVPEHYINYEFFRGKGFNKTKAKYNLNERQLQLILVAYYHERSNNSDWCIADLYKSITETSSNNLFHVTYVLIEEGFVSRVDKGVFCLTEKGRLVVSYFAKAFQGEWKSEMAKANAKGEEVVCQN